jgi:hypothetical protein
MADRIYNAPTTVSKFLRSEALNRVIMGPIGSGKSSACVIEILRKCSQQRVGPDGKRRSRWAVVRNTRQQLKDTTLNTWLDWVPPGRAGVWKESSMTFLLKYGDVEAEILFRALDSPEDVQRVLSLELTGCWLNECREIPRQIFEALQGRIKRYPSKANGGSNYWAMIADTNPPEEGSYWYNVIEKLPTEEGNEASVVHADTFKQPSGLSPDADNTDNLDPTYYTELIRGKTIDWVNTYVHGMYSPSQSGKPVYYGTFKGEKHVATERIKYSANLPIIIGMDFGLTPAAAFMQVQPTGRLFILREIAEFDMGIKRFIEQRLHPTIKNYFTENPIIIIGDPAGVRRSDTDEGTCFKMLKEYGYRAKPAATNDPIVRIGTFMEVLTLYPDGEPMVLIDPSCKLLIEGFRSKYRYMKYKGSDDKYSDKPEKNKWSHIMEAAQYGTLFANNKYDASDFARYGISPMDQFYDRTKRHTPADSYTGY